MKKSRVNVGKVNRPSRRRHKRTMDHNIDVNNDFLI